VIDPLAVDLGAVDIVAIAAVCLLALGVVGSLVPALPGPLLSLAGVYLYWLGSGFTEPGAVLLAALTLLGLLAITADFGAEVVSARVGGASLTTSLVAGAVGIVLFVFVTPVGALLGVVAVVFALEYRRHRDAARGAKAAGAVVLGVLGSAVVQVLLTASMLVAFATGVLL